RVLFRSRPLHRPGVRTARSRAAQPRLARAVRSRGQDRRVPWHALAWHASEARARVGAGPGDAAHAARRAVQRARPRSAASAGRGSRGAHERGWGGAADRTSARAGRRPGRSRAGTAGWCVLEARGKEGRGEALEVATASYSHGRQSDRWSALRDLTRPPEGDDDTP